MKVTTKHSTPVGRPRSETARRAILDAALALAGEHGYNQVTLLDIAQTAKVGRQTIYRWWPKKSWLYFEAVIDQFDQAAKVSPLEQTDLETYLSTILRIMREKSGTLPIALLLEAQHDDELRKRLHRALRRRRNMLKTVVEHDVKKRNGQLKMPIDVVVDMLSGVLWYRMLYQFAPLDEALARDAAAVVRCLANKNA